MAKDEMTQWTWVWVNSGSWWWTGGPGVLQLMGLQSHTRLSDWTELIWNLLSSSLYLLWSTLPHLINCSIWSALSSTYTSQPFTFFQPQNSVVACQGCSSLSLECVLCHKPAFHTAAEVIMLKTYEINIASHSLSFRALVRPIMGFSKLVNPDNQLRPF